MTAMENIFKETKSSLESDRYLSRDTIQKGTARGSPLTTALIVLGPYGGPVHIFPLGPIYLSI